MTGIVRYSGFDVEDLNALDEVVDDLAGSAFMDLEQGENVVRILPGLNGASPFRVTAMHYVDAVPGLDKTLAFACPRHELKEACPVCAESARLQQSANPLDRERGKKLEANLRVYCNVINRLRPKSGIKVLGFGKSVWTALKEIRKNPRLGGDFTNPTESGFDIVIVKEGSGMKTKYHVSAARDSQPLADTPDEINLILSSQEPLEKHVNPQLPDELQGMFRAAQLRAPAEAPAAGRERIGAGLMAGRQAAQAGAAKTVTTTGSAVDDAKSFADDFEV